MHKSKNSYYVITPVWATMPDGSKRHVQTYNTKSGVKAKWNMTSPIYPKGKHCAGTIEKTATGWRFKFKDPKLHADYMKHCRVKRLSYKDRSPLAVAERRRLWHERRGHEIATLFEY